MTKPTKHGLCKLTKTTGKFVDAHIIPRALTRPSAPGVPFVEAGHGCRPIRRFDSWYDSELVTREGEDHLSEIDARGIAILREYKLVWSGLSTEKHHAFDDMQILDPASRRGLRSISRGDWKQLRLFLLSILWRAAASTRPAFREVVVPDEDLQQLAQMILTRNPEPLDFYPMFLTQLTSRGPNHNFSPLAMDLDLEQGGGAPGISLPIFRFYFDGLIIYAYRPFDGGEYERPCGIHVGENEALTVLTLDSNESWQIGSYNKAISDVERDWPEVLDQLSPKEIHNAEPYSMPKAPDIGVGEGLGMSHEMVSSLRGDVFEALGALKNGRDSQFLRRSFARAVFAYVEALFEAVRNDVRASIRKGEFDGELSEKDKETIGYTWHVGSLVKMLPLDIAAKRTFKLAAKVWAIDFELETGGEFYRDFIKAKSNRNRLTHPRTFHDIDVTDDEMALYLSAGQWAESETQRLFNARVDSLIEQMPPHVKQKMQEMLASRPADSDEGMDA